MTTTYQATHHITEPVVFFPGLLCDERIYSACWQHLDMPMRAFVPLHWAEDINQMKMLSNDRLDYFAQKVHLVGFSMGGYIAALTAIENQSRIASLTLIGSSCDTLPQDELDQRKQLLALIQNKRYSGMSKQRLISFLHKSQHQNSDALNTLKQMEHDLGAGTLVAQMLATQSRKNLLTDLTQCAFPIHLLAGEEDNLVSKSTILTMHEMLPTSDFVIFEKAGHMLPIEQPRVLAEYLAAKFG